MCFPLLACNRYCRHKAGEHGGVDGGDHGSRVPPDRVQRARLQQQQRLHTPVWYALASALRPTCQTYVLWLVWKINEASVIFQPKEIDQDENCRNWVSVTKSCNHRINVFYSPWKHQCTTNWDTSHQQKGCKIDERWTQNFVYSYTPCSMLFQCSRNPRIQQTVVSSLRSSPVYQTSNLVTMADTWSLGIISPSRYVNGYF